MVDVGHGLDEVRQHLPLYPSYDDLGRARKSYQPLSLGGATREIAVSYFFYNPPALELVNLFEGGVEVGSLDFISNTPPQLILIIPPYQLDGISPPATPILNSPPILLAILSCGHSGVCVLEDVPGKRSVSPTPFYAIGGGMGGGLDDRLEAGKGSMGIQILGSE